MIKFFVILIFCCLAPHLVFAEGGNRSLYDFNLPRIKGEQDLSSFSDQASTIMIFQPHCIWCQAQFRTLKKMQQKEQVRGTFLAIGINGRHSALIREFAHANIDIAAFKSSVPFFKNADLDKATPVILILSPQGKIIKKLRGYQDETRLRQVDNLLSHLNRQSHASVAEDDLLPAKAP